MATKSYEGVKRSGLAFKGEDPRTKKKRRHEKERSKPGEPTVADDADGVAGSHTDSQVPMFDGTGRIVTSTTTVHGFETKFKEEMEVGDTIIIHHPVSLEVEMRVVVGILSQRSCSVHQSFSKDLASTMEYHIRKDSLRLKEKAKAQVQQGEVEDEAEALQDAASRELQKQLDKKLKKQRKMVTVREKTGMWGYKVVTKTLSKEATQEELLDERCKQGRDKYCF